MKKLTILLLLITGLLNSNGFGFPQTKTEDEMLKKLRAEVKENLTSNLLPYWTNHMIDNKNGGFYGRIDSNDKVYPAEDKGGILNARILWTYSAAYNSLKDTSYLRLAKRAYRYIADHFLDKEYGGAYLKLKAGGEPSDSRKQVYTQSFFIYGLSEYYLATGDKESLENAKKIYSLLEKYAADKKSGGYFEVFTRDWHRSHDLLIGELTAADEKTMNTHLHLMEAYANLYRVWPDKGLEKSLRNLVELFAGKIIDPETSHLICFMDRDWKRTSSVDSYGHDIESSWLLYEAAGLLSDPALLERVKKLSIRIANAAVDGLQPDGSLIYEKNYVTGHKEIDRSWWAQAETVVGYLNAYELTGNKQFLDYSINCWNYISKYLVDKKNGGWFSSVSEAGIPGKGDKAGFWVCPYHNGRMCLEVMRLTYPHP